MNESAEQPAPNDAAKPFAFYRPASFRFTDWLARRLPAAILSTLAGVLADAVHWLFPNLRRNVRDNLRHIFPGDPLRVRALARQAFRNYARQLLDYSRAAHLSDGELLAWFGGIDGQDRIDAALAHGRGVIVVTAHFGNWEHGGLTFPLRGYKLNAVTLEEHLDQLTLMREQYRARRGIHTIRIGRSPFAFIDILDALRRNEIVAMLVERPYPRAAVQVEFFGKPAMFSNGPVVLAMTTGAAILPGFVWRGDNGRYLARVLDAVPLESFEDRARTIRHNTQKIAKAFEGMIREHPDQWYNFVPIWGK